MRRALKPGQEVRYERTTRTRALPRRRKPLRPPKASVSPCEEMRVALKNLIDASGHVSPFGYERSVKSIRAAAKYMKAFDAAKAALAKAEVR